MIFRDDVPRRLSWSGAIVILMVAAVVLPGWSLGQGGDDPQTPSSIEAATLGDSEPAREAESAVESKAEGAAKSESGGWRSVNAGAETKQEAGESRVAEPTATLPLPADSFDTMRSPPIPPAAAYEFPAPIAADAPAIYDSGPPVEGGAVPALKDLKTPTTIESRRLKNRDALGVLQILAAVMAAAQTTSSDELPFVLAFTPASEETATVPAATVPAGSPPGPTPITPMSSAEALPPVIPNGSPLIQPPTPGIAPSWPAVSVASTSPAYAAGYRSVRQASTSRPSPPIRLAVDVRTNTLIVRGQKDGVEHVLNLVARLDSDEESPDETSSEESVSEPLGCQVIPVTHRDPNEISAVLRGLGINVDINPLQSSKKAGNTLVESGLFLVLSDSDAEEIAKLIKSLDIDEEPEQPTEDTMPDLPEPAAEGAPDDGRDDAPVETALPLRAST